MSDAAVRDRIVAGDERALAQLYDSLASRVYGLALFMLGETSEAEEVVSDTFVQVWRTAESYDSSRAGLEGWVLAICRSRALDRIRTRKRRDDLSASQQHRIASFTTSEAAPDPAERAILSTQMSDIVHPALCKLAPEKRRAIELAYLGGLSQREVARELDVPLGTVKTRIQSGMRALRDGLGSTGAALCAEEARAV